MKNIQILLFLSKDKVCICSCLNKCYNQSWQLASTKHKPIYSATSHSPSLRPEVFLLAPQCSKEHYLLKEVVLSTLLMLENSDLRAAKTFSWADARFLAVCIYCLLLYFLQVWIRVRKKKQSQKQSKRQKVVRELWQYLKWVFFGDYTSWNILEIIFGNHNKAVWGIILNFPEDSFLLTICDNSIFGLEAF